MNFFDKFKPSKKVTIYMINRQGKLLRKKKTVDNGKIYHEGKTYAYTSKQTITFKGQKVLFFWEDNPMVIDMTHKENPVMDSESFTIALKMEAIKAIEDVDDTRRKEMMIVLVMIIGLFLLNIITALKVFGQI